MTDRWSLEALAARYELHPSFREVFVEGDGDKGLVQWFFEVNGRSDVLVYPITSVEVPLGIIEGRGLETSSRRSEVIVLALELERQLTREVAVTCIADSDLEWILPRRYDSKFLMYTDYTSMEMYAASPGLVQKLVRIVAPSLNCSGELVLAAISDVLQLLFSMRATSHHLRFGLHWISFEKLFTLDGSRLNFDDEEFLARYLNTKGKRKEAARFEETMAELRGRFRDDARFQMRGHDFLEVLTWYLKKQSVRSCRDLTDEMTRRILFAQLTAEELLQNVLFRGLLDRYPQLPDE